MKKYFEKLTLTRSVVILVVIAFIGMSLSSNGFIGSHISFPLQKVIGFIGKLAMIIVVGIGLVYILKHWNKWKR